MAQNSGTIWRKLSCQEPIEQEEDVDKYIRIERQDLPIIRVFEDHGSELPESEQLQKSDSMFDDLRFDKLQIQQSNPSDGRATSWSHTDDNNSQNQLYVPKPRTRQQLNTKIVESNPELFNVHYAKSLYTSKISQLVDQKIATNPKSGRTSQGQLQNKLSKSQQKIKRKSSHQFQEQSEQSDNMGSQQSGFELTEDRLARNRTAARNSRARKRLYFELLENKVKDLEDEIERLNELCQNQARQLQKYQECTENFQNNVEMKFKLLQELEVCQLKSDDEERTIGLLEKLKEIQLNGIQQAQAEQYIEKILELLLPIEKKYIIYSYEQNKDLLSDFQNSNLEWMKETLQLMEVKPEQIRKIKKQKEKLSTTKKCITSCINNFYTSLRQIINETIKVDSIWNQIYEQLNPQQIRQFLLAIHQNSHRSVFEIDTLFNDCKYIKSPVNSDDQRQSRPQKLRQYVKSIN